jgi:ribosomal protein S18 acetylase RimI-like enzyme
LIVEAATEVTPALVDAFVRLTPLLSKSSPPPDEAMLNAIVTCPTNTLLMAYDDDGRAVGTLTLVVFPIPTGIRAWIEDVIVDESARGQGVGAALSKAAIDRAAALGVRTVDLTSRPSREAANRLYQRLGFKQRDTNVYRYADEGDQDS